ncbi:MAG: MFS transporter [Microcoleaceae cyanobacterium]
MMRKLICLMAIFYFIQTYASNPGIFSISLELYLKENLNFKAAELTAFLSLAAFPWFFKPIWGLIADSFTLFGYHLKSYFIVCYAVAAIVLFYLSRFQNYQNYILLISLVIISICISFSDVLTDKLMVVEGKLRGQISVLQASQWTARGLGGALMYYLGGWVAQNANLSLAFLITAFVPMAGLIAALTMLSEPKVASEKKSWKISINSLWSATKSWQFITVIIFITCFRCRPEPPLFYYQRDILNFSAEFLGILGALTSISIAIGAILFGIFAPKFSLPILLNFSMAFKVTNTIALIFISNEQSAILIWIFCGLTDVIATLGVLEIAARSCPKNAEGTAYALLMSVWNFAGTPGIILGGWLWDKGMSFSWLVIICTIFSIFCWLLLPLLKLEKLRFNSEQ